MCQPTGTTVTSAGVVAISAEAICSFCWSCLYRSCLQLLLEPLLVFLAKFPLLENYMFSPYIILVSNRLVG